METQNNTGLGLIKTSIKRVQNQKSLFASALKKLVNSNEEDLAKFLGEVRKAILKNLTFLCEVLVGVVTEFVVGEKFQQRLKNKVGIQLYFGDNFSNWILTPMKNVKVSLSKELKLKKFSLLKPMHDTEIQAELQNPNPIDAEEFLPLLWGMLSLQKNGEEKNDGLLVNGYANIFHVRLKNGSVVAVGVDWDGDEWSLDARGLDCGRRWIDGFVFFSPATL